MIDPKHPILNAMDCLSGAIPKEPPDDHDLVIRALGECDGIKDVESRRTLLDVIEELQLRNATIESVVIAWEKASHLLRSACQMIDETK